MTRQTPSRHELLDALIRAAREERPEEAALKRTLAVLGFANALGITGVACGAVAKTAGATVVAAAEAASASLGAGSAVSPGAALAVGSGALGKAASLGAAAAAPAVVTATVASPGAAIVPIALAKWFAVGIIAGAGTLGAGAVVQNGLDVSRHTDHGEPESQAALRMPRSGQPGNAHLRPQTRPSDEAPPTALGGATGGRDERRLAAERASSAELVAATTPGASQRGQESEAATMPGASQRGQESEPSEEPPPGLAASPLREEVEGIERSRSALRTGEAAATIGYAEQYLRRFPRGVFVTEAYYLIMEASVRSGDIEGAKRSARVLIARFPNSALSVKARQVLEIR